MRLVSEEANTQNIAIGFDDQKDDNKIVSVRRNGVKSHN
jgi:hypothetical protein